MSCAGSTWGDIYAGSWKQRVMNVGGQAPSAGTLSAAVTFINALQTAGILTKMRVVNFYAPDSREAAQTPIIRQSGYERWLKLGTATTNISVVGLYGSTNNFGFNTGIIPSSIFTANDFGYTECKSTNSTAGTTGCTQNVGTYSDLSMTMVIGDGSQLVQGRVWNQNSFLQANTTAATNPGYCSMNRTGALDFRIFYARTGYAHAQVDSDTTNAGGSPPGIAIYTHSRNDNGTRGSTDAQARSFTAVHLGLALAESLSLFNAVQALRTSLGGGTV